MFFYGTNRSLAFQTKGERAEAAGQIQPRDNLAELPRRLQRTHITAVADAALLEQVAVARQHDTSFTAGNLGDLAIPVVVAIQGIETRHAQHPGQSAQMGIGDEVDYPQRPLAQALQGLDVERIEPG